MSSTDDDSKLRQTLQQFQAYQRGNIKLATCFLLNERFSI